MGKKIPIFHKQKMDEKWLVSLVSFDLCTRSDLENLSENVYVTIIFLLIPLQRSKALLPIENFGCEAVIVIMSREVNLHQTFKGGPFGN